MIIDNCTHEKLSKEAQNDVGDISKIRHQHRSGHKQDEHPS